MSDEKTTNSEASITDAEVIAMYQEKTKFFKAVLEYELVLANIEEARLKKESCIYQRAALAQNINKEPTAKNDGPRKQDK